METDPPSREGGVQARATALLTGPAGCAFLLLVEGEGMTVAEATSPTTSFALAAAAADATNPWALDDRQAMVAEVRDRAHHLRPLAEAVIAAPGASWWWADLDREHQHEPRYVVERDGRAQEQEPLRPPVGPPSGWERYAQKHATARWTSTVRDGRSALSVAIAYSVGDLNDVVRWTTVREIAVGSETTVAEVHAPLDWHRLCVRYPAQRTHPSPLPSVQLVPDWSAVARDHAGVHLSFGGWLTSLWTTVTSESGPTTLWAWDSESTMWLREDVLEEGAVGAYDEESHRGPDVGFLRLAARGDGQPLVRVESEDGS